LSLRKDEVSTSGRPGGPVTPPFRRVLVANRGEIAVRIFRTCRELGIESVAVYSDADAGAGHVRAADVAVRIGRAPALESYLRIDAILDAARRTGAEAVHPGYGFLAERAEFAAAVEAAGLVFVGPDAATIGRLGDKLAARRGAVAVGVPVVPGTLEPAPTDRPDTVAAILAEADRIGYPLLVKAAAGGGGRGMRRVERAADLPAALAAGAHESSSAFGDGTVYLEREILPARHIEVQLLGDSSGAVVALGERDCSIQRRHQKLVEEAPAPGLAPADRRELHELAVRIAAAAGLRNAATAEFLRDADGRFWFLEVNTRLQVEHGVTELVTGLDIVAEQFHLAAGAPLSPAVLAAAARAESPIGHAIEVRLSAEDPGRAFAPAAGTVSHWVMPAGPGVRVDTALSTGDRVPPEYDSLVAKVLVHAATRDEAIARLRRALDETEVGGIQTTLPFDHFLVRHPSFRAGELSTGWVDAWWDGPAARGSAVRIALLAAALAALRERDGGAWTAAREGVATATDGAPAAGAPARADPWRSAGRSAAVERWPR
jgi:acetyl/propionyl-CoA carboxylase alpha subunit